MDSIKILVADQQELVASGLKEMLKEEKQRYKIVGHAGTGTAVLTFLANTSVDLVIIDVTLPDMDGIDTTREVRKKHPAQKLLAHSSLTDIEYINSMRIEGTSGYLLKGASKQEFMHAIDKVMNEEEYLSPAVRKAVENGYSHTNKEMDGEYIGLTPREKEIIRLIAREKTNQEMADALFLSLETIKSHRKNLMTKLNVKSVAGLVKYAVDRAWV